MLEKKTHANWFICWFIKIFAQKRIIHSTNICVEIKGNSQINNQKKKNSLQQKKYSKLNSTRMFWYDFFFFFKVLNSKLKQHCRTGTQSILYWISSSTQSFQCVWYVKCRCGQRVFINIHKKHALNAETKMDKEKKNKIKINKYEDKNKIGSGYNICIY